MLTNLIVLFPPLFDDDSAFFWPRLSSYEDFSIGQLTSEFPVEAFDKTICQKAARFDEQGLDRQLVQLGADLFFGEFGAMI